MRLQPVTVFCLGLLMCSGVALAQPAAPAPAGGGAPPPLTLTSTAYADGAVIPDKYTGNNPTPVSPELHWGNEPAGTVSFALIMHDPEAAPAKSSTDILHWMVFDIPATVHELPEGLPKVAEVPGGGLQAATRPNNFGFMGPGARNVYHHYTIEMYALDTKLGLPATATRAQVLAAMDGHVLTKGVLIGRFHR